MAEYGYAWYPEDGSDSEDSQIKKLKALGLDTRTIFEDREYGTHKLRPALQQLLKVLKPDDVVYITAIDRLGSGYKIVRDRWRKIVTDRSSDIVVLDNPALDTRRGRSLINGAFLAVMDYVVWQGAQGKSESMKEVLRAVKERGVSVGRPKMEFPEEFIKAYKGWENETLSTREASELCGISRSAFRYRVKIYEERTKNKEAVAEGAVTRENEADGEK